MNERSTWPEAALKHKDQIMVSDPIDLHIADIAEAGKEIGRFKGSAWICCGQTFGKMMP